jgi:hypothetical protein
MAGWAPFYESWHDFFLLAGTAAVTLAGLLFVALSIHIEALVHETRAHLLSLARATLLSFTMVLTLSLMMLVPGQTMRRTAVGVLAVGVVGAGVTVLQLRGGGRGGHPEFPRRVFRRRLVLPLVGYASFGLAGVGMLALRDPEMFYLIIGAICMLLGNAAGASWDLLVRTAKMRGAEGRRPTA